MINERTGPNDLGLAEEAEAVALSLAYDLAATGQANKEALLRLAGAHNKDAAAEDEEEEQKEELEAGPQRSALCSWLAGLCAPRRKGYIQHLA